MDHDHQALVQLLYPELRALANQYLSRERDNHTLQPTALVHEAWLRLADQHERWRDRGHAMAIAAMTMRRVLVDHARRRGRDRRGGGRLRIDLTHLQPQAEGNDPSDSVDLLALNDALERLAAQDARKARVVEMRFFGGLTSDDIAEELGVTDRTVRSDWAFARAWLHRELQP